LLYNNQFICVLSIFVLKILRKSLLVLSGIITTTINWYDILQL